MVRAVLLIAGVSQLLIGAWAFAAPGSFYDLAATYPPENDHFLKDIGSWNVALGLAAVIAARTPSWRAGMLAVLAIQYGLHAASHAIDLDQAESRSAGIVTLVIQIVAAGLLAALFARERSGSREPS
jgi:predicted anti-sigma-YlaC factor YlaD